MYNIILASGLYGITLSIFLATSDRYVLLIHITQLLLSLNICDKYKRMYYLVNVLYAILFLPDLNNLFIWLWVSVSFLLQLLLLYLDYKECMKDKRETYKESCKKYGMLNASVTLVNAINSILTFITKVNFGYLWIPYGLPIIVYIIFECGKKIIANVRNKKPRRPFINDEQESLFGINGA